MATPARDLLESLFRTAVATAHPSQCLPANLPEFPSSGRLIILAAGKAAGSMTEVAEQHYLAQMAERNIAADRLAGVAVTRHGYGGPPSGFPSIEAGHPVPDEAGIKGTERALAFAEAASEGDLVVVLLSGGASANWIAPAKNLTLAEKQAVTRALLRSGANIGEINTVRKHLSRIKGGRLAQRAQPAGVVTLAISDVPGDDPAVIGSGPTVPDPTTLADARAIISKYRLEVPEAVTRALADPANESPKPGAAFFAGTKIQDRRAAGRRAARRAGTRRSGRVRKPGPGRPPARRSARGRRRACPACPRPGGAGPPRRHPFGRRTHRHAAGPGTGRAQSGICAGARRPSRWGHGALRPLPPTPMEPMAAAGVRTIPPAPSSTKRRSVAPGRPASIPPRFSRTTIPRGFSMVSAICSGPAPRSRT